MGFLDKAKKLAEQAQTKLDEVQTQINQQGSSRPGGQQPGGHVEYDKHGRPLPPQQPPGGQVQYDPQGRPIPPQQSATPPHGDPLGGAPAAPPWPGQSQSPSWPPPGESAPPTYDEPLRHRSAAARLGRLDAAAVHPWRAADGAAERPARAH